MIDKRFKVVQDPRVQTEYFIYDNEDKISENITDYPFGDQDVCSRIVMLLNEQQEKITELEIELTDCKNRKEQFEYKNTKLIAKIDFLERVIDGDV